MRTKRKTIAQVWFGRQSISSFEIYSEFNGIILRIEKRNVWIVVLVISQYDFEKIFVSAEIV